MPNKPCCFAPQHSATYILHTAEGFLKAEFTLPKPATLHGQSIELHGVSVASAVRTELTTFSWRNRQKSVESRRIR